MRTTLDWTDNEPKLVNWLNENAMKRIVARLNPAIRQVNGPITNDGSVPCQNTHINGGTVTGGDPGTSVVNTYCRVWGMPDRIVIGASTFPRKAGDNPTGTVGALAYHAADAIVAKYPPSPGMIA